MRVTKKEVNPATMETYVCRDDWTECINMEAENNKALEGKLQEEKKSFVPTCLLSLQLIAKLYRHVPNV